MPPDQGQPFAQFIEFGVQFLHRSGSSVVLFDMVSLRGLWVPLRGGAEGCAPGNGNGAPWPGIRFMVPQVVRGCARGYGVTSCAFFHARRLMKIEHAIRYAELTVGLMAIPCT